MLIDSGATAIRRTGPSTLARFLVARDLIKSPVFDWGCGRGADIEFYRGQGLCTGGYDPNHKPLPLPGEFAGRFPFVTNAFVLNVIDSPADRLALLKDIYNFLPAGGTVAVAVRTAGDIAQAVNDKWLRFGDGYITTKNTFQHGFTSDELVGLCASAGFTDIEVVKNEPLFVIAKKG